jgi:DNA modification methylase
MIIHGDCLDVMKDMEADSIDSIVTDPPYGLSFMGKDWDHGVPGKRFWKEALRIAKPGAHLLAFGGTRTFHRLACAIEDAGWEIRDTVGWIYGSGFPKSHNVGKAIDKAAGAKREIIGETIYGDGKGRPDSITTEGSNEGWKRPAHENYRGRRTITAPATEAAKQWDGWGTALKPAWEPVIVARKPFKNTVAGNVLEWGTGAINVDGCRVEGVPPKVTGKGIGSKSWRDKENRKDIDTETREWIQPNGRWPANVIHDGSDEVLEVFPEAKSGKSNNNAKLGVPGNTTPLRRGKLIPRYDIGSAARFFYCAKASKKERNAGLEGMPLGKIYPQNNSIERKELNSTADKRVENHHPTVKPIALMRYLCRLVTPPNGTVFDPFMGSGSTGVAAIQEGFEFIGCDIEEEYVEIAKKRIEHARNEDAQLRMEV